MQMGDEVGNAKTIRYTKGWVDQVVAGKPFKMIKGGTLKEQTTQKRIREHGELFTPAEVAEKLKVEVETIYTYMHNGDHRGRKLGFFPIGRHYRISELHLEAFLRA